MNNWDKKRKQKEKREEGNAALRYEAIYYRKLAIVENAVQLKKRAFCCEWPQKCGASGQVLSNGARVLHFPDIFFSDCSLEFICSWPICSARSICNQHPPRGVPFFVSAHAEGLGHFIKSLSHGPASSEGRVMGLNSPCKMSPNIQTEP